MAAQKKYPDELRERAVKMVFEIRERDGKGHVELLLDSQQEAGAYEQISTLVNRLPEQACSGSPLSDEAAKTGSGSAGISTTPHLNHGTGTIRADQARREARARTSRTATPEWLICAPS
jgi:hypothetical protein